MKIVLFWIFFILGIYALHSIETGRPIVKESREIRLSQARYLLTEFGYTPKQIAEIINS